MAAGDLAWALKALRDTQRLGGYRAAQSYYDGDHPLTFATQKFREVFGQMFGTLADNLCPAVVDSISDRLKITAITASDDVSGAAETAWRIWQRNRMDVRAPETHHEALLTGDGYALAWPDQAGEAVIWSLPACQMAVAYDPNRPGLLRQAARVWRDEETRWRVDVYYADRVERFASRASSTAPAMPPSYNAGSFETYSESGVDDAAAGVVAHDLGRVPVVHFPNRRYHAYGISELANVVPLQNALNKTVCDMIIATEFSAFVQRWATGVDVGEVDENGKPVSPPFDYGVDRILTLASADAKFGDFRTTDLTQYVEVQENLRSEIARVSGTPLHYLFITRGDFPSGEAMKSAEARFTRKVENRQVAFGNAWEDLLRLALQIDGEDVPDEGELSVVWESAAPGGAEGVDAAAVALTAQRLGLALQNGAVTREQVDALLTAANGTSAASS